MKRALFFALVAAGCTSPNYGSGHLQCSASGACPSGFYCAADDHCWRTGSGPSSSDMQSVGAPDLASVLRDLAMSAGRDMTAPPSKCATTNALLCEDFESATALANYGQNTTDGVVERDTSRAYRGVASLHAAVTNAATGSTPHAYITETKTFPIATTLYVRVWAYFSSPLPAAFNQPIEFWTSSTGGASEGIDTGNVTLNDYTGTKYYSRSTTPMPLDRWTCLQYDMTQAAAMGPINITVDGMPVDLGSTSMPIPTVSAFVVGVDFYMNPVPIAQYDAWFDEVIVDNKPTTCAE